ncbi:MAG: alanine racemase [Actinomycetota bacterium]|nr:alanine racemase [Actinomycetota bacterium]
MSFPYLKINLRKISNNARLINDRCASRGMSVVGVTKSILADIDIVKILKKSGISIFGDSRLANLIKMREYFGYGQELILLRTPMLSECEKLIEICDTSMQTEITTVKTISDLCERKNKNHNIVLMVEMDDKREGISAKQVIPFFDEVLKKYPKIKIKGLATNARCISKRRPRIKSIENLIEIKKKIASKYSYVIPVISGGNSSIWKYIEDGSIPEGVNEVRIGEAIFIGNETSGYEKIKGAFDDSFLLEAEIIEIKKKNSLAYKIIIALGIQDVPYKHLIIQNPYYDIIAQSSDHTVLSLKKIYQEELSNGKMNEFDLPLLKIGDKIIFKLDYFGLMFSMTSPFIKKIYVK